MFVPDEPGSQLEKAQTPTVVRRERQPAALSEDVFSAEAPLLAGGAAAAGSPKLSVLSTILRFKWTMMAIFLVISAPVTVGVWMLLRPVYQARAEIRVRPIIPRLVFKTEDNGMIPLYQSFMNTQVSIVRSPTVLRRVLEQEDVRQTGWYKTPPKAMLRQGADRLELLRELLSVRPRRRTEIIDVSFVADSTKDAEVIVNGALDQYILYISEMSDATRNVLDRELAAQYKLLEYEILEGEKELAKLRKKLGTSVPQELISSKRVRLDETAAALAELWREISVLEWQQRELENLTRAPSGGEKENAPTTQKAERPPYHMDAGWRRLDIAARVARHNIEVAQRKLKPVHPKMIELMGELSFTEDLRRLREAQLEEQWRKAPELAPASSVENSPDYAAELRSVQRRRKLLAHQEKLLVKEVEKQRTDFEGNFESAQSLEKEDEAVRHKRRLFQAVRERLDHKKMERNVPGSIEVLTRAFAPAKPFRDRRAVYTFLALLGALGMGVAVAFLRGDRSQMMHVAEEVPNPLRVPFLGQLPLVRKSKRLPFEDDPLLFESMRMVRTALLSRLGDRCGSVVMVSSADTGTGKSTVSVLLAKSLAQCGKRVLLIDADFRKSRLSENFGLADERGLIESLAQENDDQQGIFSTETPRLSVMPTGHVASGAALELTANGAFTRCMHRLRKLYDIVLLDSCPILPVADARILSRQVDGTIMVVREEKSRREDVVDALAYLSSSGGKLLGTIFIGSVRRHSYRSDYYDRRTEK